MLSVRERLFVRFRHHVVLAVAHRRCGKVLGMVAHGIIAIVLSPLDAFAEAVGFVSRLSEHKHEAQNP
mgnify:CR=1 FL=1